MEKRLFMRRWLSGFKQDILKLVIKRSVGAAIGLEIFASSLTAVSVNPFFFSFVTGRRSFF